MSILKKSALLVFLVLLIDQIVKIWIKTNMHLGESSIEWDWWHIEWFQLHFIENNGMAFGMEFGGEWGKMLLSLFRIVAIGGIIWYIRSMAKSNSPNGFILSLSLILAGAIGNIIDSVSYGLIFSESYYNQVATMLPEAGGYSSLLHGKVVDMLYFPLLRFQLPQEIAFLPDWLSFLEGYNFLFFRPVFNIADSAITIGVLIILLFHRKFFVSLVSEDKEEKVLVETPENN